MRKLLLCAMMLMCLATRAGAQDSSDHNLKVAKNLEVFNALYKYLELMYVDTLDADKTVGTAINAMLRSLDPYTEYYPENKTEEYRQMLTGKYAGIGSIISYSFTRKNVVINEPYANMPASEAGLKKGDIILSIDGEDMQGKTTAYVSEHLRGDAGTVMELKVRRPSTGKTMTMKIKRRAIQMPSLPYYAMMDDSIGYVKLDSYLENTYEDMRKAFMELRGKGMKRLLLDVRNNGGGSVQEALKIINMFVPKGTHLLSMKGQLESSNKEYDAESLPIDTLMPIVIVVNENTASASEITAGALQDLDRGVVIGTRTYGKGLVQVPNIELPYNGKLKITTSKYYIPSGRCIQALKYNANGTETVADSLTRVFYTANGRPVKDGGGITPDIKVTPDSLPNITFYLSSVDTTDIVLDYETEYIAKHAAIDSPDTFELTDSDYEEFKKMVIERGFTYDWVTGKRLKELEELARIEGYYEDARPEFEALAKKLTHDIGKDLDYPYNKQKIMEMLAADIVSAYYFEKGSMEYELRFDRQIKEALDLIRDTERYRGILGK